jgi:hypothetical protein
VIAERGYHSITPPTGYSLLKGYGFAPVQAKNVPGLLLPLWTTDGQQALMVYRPDTARKDARDREIKYELPKNAGVRLDCPPRCRPQLGNPAIRLWVVEGQKKADALASHGVCAIALLGVWNFKGKNVFGGVTFSNDWDYIALKGRELVIAYDSDLMTKPAVRRAFERLTEHLRRKGARVVAVYLPTEGGKKVGVDDYLLTHAIQDLEGLIEASRPQPRPAMPIFELLLEPPKELSRLLAWMDGHAYATTWLPLKITTTEYLNSQGEIERLPQPKTAYERRVFVMRDDGVLFGEAIDPKVKPLAEMGIDLAPMDKPPDRLLWNTKGVTAYLRGHRPDPVEVFGRVVNVYDHFLDFSRSLGEQLRMCRLSACMSLMTWFADAFTVLPYPWPNSPAPGSGKTKWGHCWTGTSYVGYLTSASGSFAALRDLADMGATLLFDDAEVLADPQRTGPDKHMLILAGNRKGVSIPVQERGVDGRWHTRWLNAYCPRGFTSLRLPFRALQSRSIVIPLVASPDPTRANRDPENERDWPVDRHQLVADLWALALALQRAAADMWNHMSKETSVVGRDWECWRAIIAVARLFESHGAEELVSDMWHIMSAYQEQKDELEGTSRIAPVIRALMRIVGLPESDKWTSADVSGMSTERIKVNASRVSDTVKTLLIEAGEGIEGTEGPGESEERRQQSWSTPKAVGILLSRLRLPQDRDTSRGRARHRLISPREVFQLAIGHHLVYLTNTMSDTSALVHLSEQCPDCGGHTWQEIPGSDAVCRACARQVSD